MTAKTISVSISGESGIIDGLLDAFARQSGWTETIEGDNGQQVPNPTTRKDIAAAAIKGFVSESVIAFNAQRASEAAKAKAGRDTIKAMGQASFELLVE